MIELPEPISFEWDEGNVDKNLKTHSVTVGEAEELFICDFLLAYADVKHSTNEEKRFQALGRIRSGRTLFVAFTIRERKIRVISIRDMKKKERMAYEQQKKRAQL